MSRINSGHRRLREMHARVARRKAREKEKQQIKNQSVPVETSSKPEIKTVQNPFLEHIDNSIAQAKHDYDRVIDSFEKEGATPAVLDGISGTANLGKNTIKTVSVATDTIFDYTKTGQQGFDNVVSDGIGKTASGFVGTIGETLATAGSLFSAEEGSTTKAVQNLGNEAGKVVDGGTNFVLGLVGKGWIWGKEKPEVKEKPVIKEEVKPVEPPKIEPKKVKPESLSEQITPVKVEEKKDAVETKEKIDINIEDLGKEPKPIPVQQDLLDLLNDLEEYEKNQPAPKQIVVPEKAVDKNVEIQETEKKIADYIKRINEENEKDSNAEKVALPQPEKKVEAPKYKNSIEEIEATLKELEEME